MLRWVLLQKNKNTYEKTHKHNLKLELIAPPGKEKCTITENNDRHSYLYLRSRNVLLVFSLLQTQSTFWKNESMASVHEYIF